MFNLNLKNMYMTSTIKRDLMDGVLSLERINKMLLRHLKNKSDLSEDDLKENEIAYKENIGMIFSSFKGENEKIYIITDLYKDNNRTTILYATEY